MRRLAAFLAVVALAAWPAGAREVSDATARKLDVPDNVERVFVAGPPAGLVVYSLAPEKLLGWTRAPSETERAMLGNGTDKPSLGRLTGRGGEVNLETVLKLKPDLIVDIGSTEGTYVSLADRVQEQTGVPHLLFDGRLAALPGTYRALAAVLGVSAQGEERARWIEDRLEPIQQKIASLAADRRPRVYLARGPEGLETARAGSINVEAVEYAGGRNVAGEALGGGGLVTVSLDQLLAWDPDIIVALDRGFFERVMSDPLWGQVRAVKTGRIVLAPQLPFPWVDYPPSVNRVIGTIWLANLFYPDVFKNDLRALAREFYALFYHRAPQDSELDELLANAAFR